MFQRRGGPEVSTLGGLGMGSAGLPALWLSPECPFPAGWLAGWLATPAVLNSCDSATWLTSVLWGNHTAQPTDAQYSCNLAMAS